MINKLQLKESNILKKQSSDLYQSKEELIDDICSLLDELSLIGNNIKTPRELKWVCQAAVRWESFLRGKFNIWKTINLPTVSDITNLNLSTYLEDRDILVGNIETFEKNLVNLTHTFIVSSCPTIPKENLQKVMKLKAATDRTKYIFLLSKKLQQEEKKGLYDGFNKIFQDAISSFKIFGSKPDDFFSFFSLSYDWNSFPYIFYSTRDLQGNLKIISVRGSEKGVPISDPYYLVPGSYAHDIWIGITSREPTEENLKDEFRMLTEGVNTGAFESDISPLQESPIQ